MTATLLAPSEIAPSQPVAPAPNDAAEVARPLRWSSEDYARLTEAGFFHERRVELVGGVLIDMGAMNGPHWTACMVVQDALRSVFNVGYVVTNQLPLKLEDGSEPQPDVAVVLGSARDYRADIPTTALLTVEVSVSTLRYDRGDKASLYARAQIPEYWLLNVEARQLEVYRRPIVQAEAKFGWGFAEKRIYTENESVSPLEAPQTSVPVKELLP